MTSILCDVCGLVITSYDNSFTDPQLEQAIYNSVIITYNLLAIRLPIVVRIDEYIDTTKERLIEYISKFSK